MLKTLKKKFVTTSMTAITVLLLILIGSINIVNLLNTKSRENKELDVICMQEMSFKEGGAEPPVKHPDDKPIFTGRNRYDTFMAANFFFVVFDRDSKVLVTETSRTSKVTSREASDLAIAALGKGKTTGRSSSYIYKITEYSDGGRLVVFLDISSYARNDLFVFGVSAGFACICWLMMLLLVLLLSDRAIRPIAENFEKQKQFVTNAGHEIKTPLAIIRSNTEAMELIRGKDKYSKNIKDQTERLAVLMNNLLTLAKADEGSMKLDIKNTDLSDLVIGTSSAFIQPFEMKKISFTSDLEENVYAKVDKVQTELLLSILFDNALKYTNEGGKVRMSLKKKGKKAEFILSNSCEKVPDADPERLFERFYRADSAHSQSTGGSGIGLSVARSAAESLGGSIRAEYQGSDMISFIVDL